MSNFGPLARGTVAHHVSTSLFQYSSWTAEGINAKGQRVEAQYTMLHPTGGIAYVHFLLDASGSTWEKVQTGDKKRVWQYLLQNFEHLVESGESPLLPNDVIYVWTFNMKATLLCRVERKNFNAQLMETIRAKYEKEFDGNNYKETHLYEAIATVMQKIRQEHMENKKADFFLVPFTDGMDNSNGSASLNRMMDTIDGIPARLHTIFITVNMPIDSELYKRLENQQNEINHINCETTEPNEIKRAFNTLRELIKAYLVVVEQKDSGLQMTRTAAYGANEKEIADRMMESLHIGGSSLLERWYQMKTIQGPAP